MREIRMKKVSLSCSTLNPVAVSYVAVATMIRHRFLCGPCGLVDSSRVIGTERVPSVEKRNQRIVFLLCAVSLWQRFQMGPAGLIDRNDEIVTKIDQSYFT